MPIVLGIDIGTSSVKVAAIRTAYRKTVLEALVAVDIATAGSTAEAIRQAVFAAAPPKPGSTGGNAGGESVATTIEGARAAVRTLTLPASAQKQLNEVLSFELEAQVPFEMEGAVFDYRVLPVDKSVATAGASLHVLCAVARVEDVRARIDVVREALQMEPERIAVGAFPLANLAPLTPLLSETGPVVILDLGTRSSEVLVLDGGEPVFARTLSFGTEGLPGTAPRLAREIRVSLAAFRSTGGAAPARIHLCGGGAFVSGAHAFLAAELELPVEPFPLPTLEVSPRVGAEEMALLPRFAKAAGLALGLVGRGAGLNLRRGPLAYERGFGWVKERIPVLAGLAAVMLVSLLFSTWTRLYAVSKDEEVTQKALAVVTKEVLGEETDSAARANELLGQQTGVPDEDPLPHADAYDVMIRLSEMIPQSMVHDVEELDVQKGHVTIHGVVGSIPDAQSIATSLRNEKCFTDVKISRTNQVVGGERQKYVLEMDIKCPEDQKGTKKGSTTASGGK